MAITNIYTGDGCPHVILATETNNSMPRMKPCYYVPHLPQHPLDASPIGRLESIPDGVRAYVPDPLPR